MSSACASSHFPPFSLQISLVFVLLQTTGLTAVWTTFWSILYTSQSTQHSSHMTSHVTPVPRSQLMICSAPVVPKPRQWYVLTFSNNLISVVFSFLLFDLPSALGNTSHRRPFGEQRESGWGRSRSVGWTCFLQVLRGSERGHIFEPLLERRIWLKRCSGNEFCWVGLSPTTIGASKVFIYPL